MPHCSSDENSKGLLAAAGFLVMGAILFLGACLLLWFSCLRETREFWFNSGGYPVLLRDIVEVGYYPLLIATVVGLLGLTVALCAKIRMPAGFICFESLVIAACWSLVLGSVVISSANNIENLWSGRPLHYKPPLTSR